MAQITIRLDEQLADDLRRHASGLGQSMNSFVVAVLEAAIDPDLEGTDAQRTRARLARAGLLASPVRANVSAPQDERRLRRARRAAGRGVQLSELVSDGRR